MTQSDRTSRRIAGVFFLAVLVAMLLPALAPAARRSVPIKNVFTKFFPERTHGTSVAIAPDETPWFGLRVEDGGPSIARLGASGLEVLPLSDGGEREATTTSLRFDADGSLWFVQEAEGSFAIARREASGSLSVFPLPTGEAVNELTIGPEGDVWFVRAGYGEESDAAVGRVSAEGTVTQFPLEPGSRPLSIASGPDGALWFTEEEAGKVGRITTGGQISLFDLAPEAHPNQIVTGPDGTLWFGERGRARRYGKISNRIGRITVDGAVSEFPVPFGSDTSRLVADRGLIWFASDELTLSSISPSGNVGAVGCPDRCDNSIEGLAAAPGGALWFAGGIKPCVSCGGGSDLIANSAGTAVGRISAGALAPADPAGPPARDPYATPPTDLPLPVVETGGPVEVGSTVVAVTGHIDPLGYPTTWRFKWGRTKAYGHFTEYPERPFVAEERGAGLEEFIFGLCPDRTYHYELVAYGSGGRAVGGDRTFTTKPSKHPPERCL